MIDITWANESPCFNINDIKLVVADDEGLLAHHFNFVLKPLLISNTPTYALGRCIGTQNLATLIHIAQNELLKKVI